MKLAMGIVVFTMAAAALSGCATSDELSEPDVGLGIRDLFSSPEQLALLRKMGGDRHIASLLDNDEVRAKLPGSIALARIDASYGWRYGGCGGGAAIDSAEIQAWDKTIEKIPAFTNFQPLPQLLLGRQENGVSMDSLRLAAAQMKCELLLVYVVASSEVTNYNNAATLYWTFVGLWLVPGNVIEQKTVMQAILVDCRSGAILGTCTGDSYLKGICPMAVAEIKRDKFRQQAPPAALKKLQDKCHSLLTEVAAKVQDIDGPSPEKG